MLVLWYIFRVMRFVGCSELKSNFRVYEKLNSERFG